MNRKQKLFAVSSLFFFLFFVCQTSGMTASLGIERILTPELPPGGRPNILFIVIDALRRDHLGCFGYSRDTSPTIDRLARAGVFFTDVISPSSQTAPVVASLFTGLYPHRHGVQFYSFRQAFDPVDRTLPPLLPERFTTMAEVFQSHDYATMGIVSNPWLRKEYGYGQGFDAYHFIGSWDGRHINNAFIEKLSEEPQDDSFFAYLHYMDAHAPYHNPDAFIGLFTDYKGEHIFTDEEKDRLTAEELEYITALYDEEICYVDGLVGKLIEKLEKTGLMEKTIIIITADHGEEFFDHRGLAHGMTLYGELINTFLILYCPEHLEPKRIEMRVSSLDIYPTLFDLAGFSLPESEGDGLSLIPFVEDLAGRRESSFFSELGDKKAVLKDGWKYIYNPYLKTEELYSLDSDMLELSNQVDKERRIRRKMKEEVLGLCEDLPAPGRTPARLNEEELERLRSLGYTGQTGVLLSSEVASLRRPVSDRIELADEKHNPLQLIYGEKERVSREGKKYFAVGQRLDFALIRSSKRQDQIAVEGFFDRMENQTEEVKIELFCEGGKLGERIIGKAGFFSVRFPVASSLGKDRTLAFSLLFNGPFGLGRTGVKRNNQAIPLLISAVFFD